MRLHIVNPNSTRRMTLGIAEAARAVAAPGTEIVATEPADGPVSIEGYFDEALCVPGMLREIAHEARAGADAHVIACFDDTGLDAARALSPGPVVGIGEAAYHLATLVCGRFSVITTLSRSIPALEHNIARYGLASRCARVRASDIPVLEVESPAGEARISAEIALALKEDRCDGIVLGCAGMAALAGRLAAEHGVPVIEGVSAAVKFAETLVGLGHTTSKRGGWAAPPMKPLGSFQDLLTA